MKRIALAMFVVVAALVLTNSALASSVSLTFKFDHNDHYYFSVNGSNSLSTMMCDSYDNHIFSGETWTASKSPFLTGISSSLFGPTMTLDYKAAGLIYKSMLAGSISTLQAQWAIWGLFSEDARENHAFNFYGGARPRLLFLPSHRTLLTAPMLDSSCTRRSAANPAAGRRNSSAIAPCLSRPA